MSRILAWAAGALALGLAGNAAQQAEPQEDGAQEYVCPPCGADCHERTWPSPGSCGVCGMELVPLAEVTRALVFLYEGVDLYSAGALAGLFARSNTALVSSVADTRDALRSNGLSLVAHFTYEDAPRADVLLVPDFPNAPEVMDDELALAWLRAAAEGAEQVVAVGGGCALLARAGLLEGVEVPVDARLAERYAELAAGIALRSDVDRTRGGRFRLARTAGAGVELTLELVAEIGGAPAGERVAQRLGLAAAGPR